MSIISDHLTNGRDEGTAEPDGGQPTAADSRLFHSITLRNILSFPPDNEPLELKNLNVLIGPNGSGKSNLLEAIGLLRATASDLRPKIARGGGVAEWIWKGRPDESATIDAVVANTAGAPPIRHTLRFGIEHLVFQIQEERIEAERALPTESEAELYYSFVRGRSAKIRRGHSLRKIADDLIDLNLSAVAQRGDPESFPTIDRLKESYARIRIYRDWSMGRNSVLREPQKADLRTDRLEEDFSNLGLFLNKLRRKPKAKQALLAQLPDLYEGLTDFDFRIEGGMVQVFFTEGDFNIPAPRLSDGSLRYLCLLAILCDPDPPPLICIEEPELGLHFDLLPKVADLLVEASQRCQLIVTTHSDVIVDVLSDQPESIVVCEKHEGRTSMRRLDPKELAPWLEKYRLADLWTRGGLGGTRW